MARVIVTDQGMCGMTVLPAGGALGMHRHSRLQVEDARDSAGATHPHGAFRRRVVVSLSTRTAGRLMHAAKDETMTSVTHAEPIVFKIAPAALWRDAEAAGLFAGAPVDVADGFIHFSTAAQVQETARRHFAGMSDLVLAAVDVARLGPGLKWEPSRGGELFPHLYGPLPLSAVLWVSPLPLRADGAHDFPPLA